jgi:hypothetical protein
LYRNKRYLEVVAILSCLLLGSSSIAPRLYEVSYADTKQDFQFLTNVKGGSSKDKLPQILSFKAPGPSYINQVPLVAILHGEEITLIKEQNYPKKSTSAFASYNPIVIFQFREGAKLSLVNIKQMLVGEIKQYDNRSQALKSAFLFKNIRFNEETVLELENDGLAYMVIETQFANNISGIYALALEITPNDSNTPAYRKSIQQISAQNGWTVVNSSSINIQPRDTFLLVAQSVMCHITSSYGFQVCEDSKFSKEKTSLKGIS